MICKNCKTGADVLSRAKELQEHIGPTPVLLEAGTMLHVYCTGYKHCDCQHRESVGTDVWVKKKDETTY